MASYLDYEINKYICQLDDVEQEKRISAITFLGDSGDEACLKELRERLKNLTREHQALIIAVGKLKKDLGIQ
jgi:hypothetical protein